MFKRIYIDNYRCFSNFEFRPGRINLLLGANGSGKSSFFDVLQGLIDVVTWGVEINSVFPPTSRTRWDTREVQRFELEVASSGGTYTYVLELGQDPNARRTHIKRELVQRDGKTLFLFEDGDVHLHNNSGAEKVTFPFRGDSSFLARLEDRPEASELHWLLNHLSDMQALHIDAQEMPVISEDEARRLSRTGRNFASWVRHLTSLSARRMSSLYEKLEAVLPGFQELTLHGEGGPSRTKELAAKFTTGDSSYAVGFNELSSGQRALVILYTLLDNLPSAEACLLLDEPGAHLSIPEVQPWLHELDERFTDSGQVFVISHHPEVVNYLAASEPFLFERPGGGPVRVRPAVFDHELGLRASEQLARGIFDEQ